MGFKDTMRRKAMGSITPSETRVAQEVANILTTTEFELFQAVDRLARAADAGALQVDQSVVERRDEVLAVADAVASQEFDDWWWSTVAPEFIANADEARTYVGLSKAEWREQIATWADLYRDRAPDRFDEDDPDAAIAAVHVERRFDVSLDEFAAEVVEWHAPEHVQGIIQRNLQTSIQAINDVAGSLEEPAEAVDA